MKKIIPLFWVLILSAPVLAQRNIPYPIIFVHGWTGSDKAWFGMGVNLVNNLKLNVSLDDAERRAGTGSRIDFHLNADGSNSNSTLVRDQGGPFYGDVLDYGSYINPNNDVFFVNFDNPFSNSNINSYSNQAAAVKQGFAVGLAVKKVLAATGAKKVILFGHSMGGLAIREYLQQISNWPDGTHHVAKLITTGTPHGGSNSSSGNVLSLWGKEERSEAVRDLRYPKSISFYDRGVYLYGGNELDINRLGLNFFNNDVDCDGYLGNVTGLNQKNLYLDLAYSCIIGFGGTLIAPTATGFYGDDIVESNNASIFNLGYQNLNGDAFSAYKQNEEQGASAYYDGLSDQFTWHTRLPKQRFINTYALDEPQQTNLAFEIDLGKFYRGAFTPRPNGSRQDIDLFKLLVPQAGVLTINCSVPQNTTIRLLDGNLNQVASFSGGSISPQLFSGGTYYIETTGNSGDGSAFWQFTPYNFSTSFCPLPSPPTVLASGVTTFCQGGQLILSTAANLTSYSWLKDGLSVGNNTNSISVNQAGNYSLQTSACGIAVWSANTVTVQVNPIPNKPLIVIQSQPFGLLATNATNYQWYHDGQTIDNATSSLLSAVSTGSYTVKTTVQGCTSESLPFVVTGTEESPEDLVKVYPNPTDGNFFIELPAKTAATIELIDMAGKQVYGQSDKARPTRKNIDARPIAPGIYLLKVKYEQKEIARKIIIQ